MATLTRTWWIEGIHGERPEPNDCEIPAGWQIYNAARPLPGTIVWEGEFHHGIFYAAVDPKDPYAATWRQGCIDLDGHLVVPISKDEVRDWCRAYYKQEYPKVQIDIDEFDYEDLVMSWLGYHEQFKTNSEAE